MTLRFEDPVWGIHEVCALLRLSHSQVYRLTVAGELPGFQIGSSWRYFARDVVALTRNSQSARVVTVRFTGDQWLEIQRQAARAQVSIEDFITVSANWHANEVRKMANPARMPPVLWREG